MKILILSHERSLNKAKTFILNWSEHHDLVLITESEIAWQKTYVKGCQCWIEENFHLEGILQKVPTCDFILTISENLLPLQSRLERYYGLSQLSEHASNVLANKFNFDRHCEANGLSKFVPPSVIPRSEQDFLKISGPVILKSTIGTGGYPMLASHDNRFQGMDYKIWNSSHELVEHLQNSKLLDFFLSLNREGFRSGRFNAVDTHMLLQKYIPSEEPSFTPCGFVKDGEVKICFYVRNHKVCEDENVDSAHPPHFAQIPKSAVGDFSVTSFAVEEVPIKIHFQVQDYLQTLVTSLKIQQLFFSGPDFHLWKNNLFAIDFNPRPGHFFNLIDQENKFIFTNLFWKDSEQKPWIRLRWSTCRLPVGSILTQQQLSGLSDFISEEMRQIDFSQLPHFQFLQSNPKSLQMIVSGSSEQDLQEDYNRKVTNILKMSQENFILD